MPAGAAAPAIVSEPGRIAGNWAQPQPHTIAVTAAAATTRIPRVAPRARSTRLALPRTTDAAISAQRPAGQAGVQAGRVGVEHEQAGDGQARRPRSRPPAPAAGSSAPGLVVTLPAGGRDEEDRGDIGAGGDGQDARRAALVGLSQLSHWIAGGVARRDAARGDRRRARCPGRTA